MAVTKRRLAALVTHPIQYFKPIFQGLAADPDFGVTFAWDSNPIEGFPSSFASRAPLQALSSSTGAWPIARQAAAQIQAFEPDSVLVFSYSRGSFSSPPCC